MSGFAMINLFHKTKFKLLGAATLIITVILIVLSTLMIIFAASYGQMQQKMTANQNRESQAFHAAEAGVEFAINYLQTNETTITGAPSAGLINYSDANTTNVSLANGSKFSVVYTNPSAYNYNLIQITSTGANDDSSSTRVVVQQVQLGSLLSQPGTTALTTKGSVAMTGNATITNTSTNNAINSASTVVLGGSAATVISGGGTGIQQNNTALANTSQSDFFATYFGTTNTAKIQNSVGHYYSNSSNTDYSSNLSGMSGTSIWIDQTAGTASISGNTTIGSSSNPVLIIVNGTLSLSGNVTIYGFVFVIGTAGITTLTGNTSIIGGMATSDNLSMAGNISLTFNNSVLSNLQNQSSMRYFAKVPGTWRDF